MVVYRPGQIADQMHTQASKTILAYEKEKALDLQIFSQIGETMKKSW